MADRDELLEHAYDGIEEYDNDLPRWWLWLFAATVVFGVIRTVYYHFGPGLLQDEQVALQLKELDEIRAQADVLSGAQGDADLMPLVSNPELIKAGQTVYMTNCVPCHGPQGGGIVGPNLTDDHWMNGGKLADIKRTIEAGVPEKGMLAWKGILSNDQITSVSVFVWSIHGSNPAGGKPPEGRAEPRV